ncbi:unnamed protein product, partial [Ectocarpus sp. 12 AP-2014]
DGGRSAATATATAEGGEAGGGRRRSSRPCRPWLCRHRVDGGGSGRRRLLPVPGFRAHVFVPAGSGCGSHGAKWCWPGFARPRSPGGDKPRPRACPGPAAALLGNNTIVRRGGGCGCGGGSS